MVWEGWFLDDSKVFEGAPQPMANLLNFSSCSAGCPALLYDPLTGKYNYVSSIETDYIRKIEVTQVSADEVKVSSTVSWLQVSGTKSVTLSENLYNWIE